MRAVPWYIALVAAVVAGFAYLTRPADHAAEIARLRAGLDSAEVVRDSVASWAAAALAARDAVMARERADARRAIAVAVPVAAAAAVVLENPAAPPDTLRATIQALLWSNADLSARLSAYLVSDSARVAQTDSTWSARVEAERAVSGRLRALNASTERQLRVERGKRVRDALAGAGVGLLAGMLWRR